MSVAAAYFEDSLQRSPDQLLVAGTLGAETVAAMMEESGVEGLRVREMVEPGMMEVGSSDGECAAGLAGRCPGSAEELMRISVNLANRPFVELRPLFARLRLAMALLAVLAVGLGFCAALAECEGERGAGADGCAEGEDAASTSMSGMVNEARMHQPQNMAVLERSQFLNAVFARKSFSWTAVMMDLEKVLPAGVQVTSIEPQITKEGDVNIRLRVSGDRERAVQLVRNLETSQRFLSPRLASEQAQTQEGNRSANASSAGAGGGAVRDIEWV